MIEMANRLLAVDGKDEIMAIALAEAVHDMDGWLRMGGFLPDAWRGLTALQVLERAQEVGTMKDDDRPLKDAGKMCAFPKVRDIGLGGTQTMPCTLDKGHEGEHSHADVD